MDHSNAYVSAVRRHLPQKLLTSALNNMYTQEYSYIQNSSFEVMGCSMGPYSQPCRILFLMFSLLMPVDMVTDILTIHEYHKMCQAGELMCLFWKLGLFFLFLPTIIATIFWGYIYYKDRADWKDWILYGPLYSIYIPCYVIKNAAKAALCCDMKDEEEDRQDAAGMKLFEVFGEALPQVSSTCFT